MDNFKNYIIEKTEFHNRLKELRERKIITQQTLADLLGLTRQAISLYEKGKREPKYVDLLKLSNYFNVSVDFMLGN